MSDVDTAAAWTHRLYILLEPLLWPVATYLAYALVAELRRRGYQTTYALAIPRAMGAGVIEAQKRGLDPFSAAGRAVVLVEGTAYLAKHVGDEATKLGIEESGHAERVQAQMGVAVADAQAQVLATAATVASSIAPAAAVLDAAMSIKDAVQAFGGLNTDSSGPHGPPPNTGSSGSPPPYYPPGAR